MASVNSAADDILQTIDQIISFAFFDTGIIYNTAIKKRYLNIRCAL